MGKKIYTLKKKFKTVLGCGSYAKISPALILKNKLVVMPVIDAVEEAYGVEKLNQMVEDLIALTEGSLSMIAHDLHPDFYTTRLARFVASERGIPLLAVQHHHAHIASVLAEHQKVGPVLGVALDGFGIGPEKDLWGGELLFVLGPDYQRLGHFRTLLQPSGDKTAREPWRMGASALFEMGKKKEIVTHFSHIPGIENFAEILNFGLNARPTSSCGRLFDAASALLHVCETAETEGEAPQKLEALVTEPAGYDGGFTITPTVSGGLVLDFLPLLEFLLGQDPETGANVFHGTLCQGIASWVHRAHELTGIKTVVFSGGCFLNRVLRETLRDLLTESGFTVLVPEKIPLGDGAIGIGQAYVAALKAKK